MAVLKPVASAVNKSWLNVDTNADANLGFGDYRDKAFVPQNEVAQTAAPAIPYDTMPIQGSTEVLYETNVWESNWPGFSQGDWTQGPAQVQERPSHGHNDTSHSRTEPLTNSGPGDGSLAEFAGYAAQSQVTDTHGWKINIPNGRSSEFKVVTPGAAPYGNQWPHMWGVRAVEGASAITSVPNIDQPGNAYGVPSGQAVPYASTEYGGQGNIAYETPGGPQTMSPTQMIQATQNAGPDWKWGQF